MSVFNVGLLLEKLYTYFLISNQTWVPQPSAHIYTKNELMPFLCLMCAHHVLLNLLDVRLCLEGRNIFYL